MVCVNREIDDDIYRSWWRLRGHWPHWPLFLASISVCKPEPDIEPLLSTQAHLDCVRWFRLLRQQRGQSVLISVTVAVRFLPLHLWCSSLESTQLTVEGKLHHWLTIWIIDILGNPRGCTAFWSHQIWFFVRNYCSVFQLGAMFIS